MCSREPNVYCSAKKSNGELIVVGQMQVHLHKTSITMKTDHFRCIQGMLPANVYIYFRQNILFDGHALVEYLLLSASGISAHLRKWTRVTVLRTELAAKHPNWCLRDFCHCRDKSGEGHKEKKGMHIGIQSISDCLSRCNAERFEVYRSNILCGGRWNLSYHTVVIYNRVNT